MTTPGQPPGWATAKVADLGSLRLGKMLDKAKNKGMPTPYLRNINVRWFGFDLGGVQSILVSDEERETLAIRDGDLLICEGGEPGRCAIWAGGDTDLVFQKAVHRFRTNTSVLPEWLMYLLKFDAQRGTLDDAFTGTTIKHLTGESLGRYEVPVAPLAEQRRIVATVRGLLARSRSVREALDAIQPLLDMYRQSVLSAAFRGDLTAVWRERQTGRADAADTFLAKVVEMRGVEQRRRGNRAARQATDPLDLPTGWVWTTLEEISWASGYGTSGKCSYEPTNWPVLRIPNVAGGKIDPHDLKYSILSLDMGREELLRQGDMLVVRTNGSRDLIGRATVITDDRLDGFYFASYLIRFRLPKIPLLWRWIGLIWQSPQVRDAIERSAATSAGQYNVNLEKLGSVRIPLPPEAELEALVSLVEAHLQVYDAQTEGASAAAREVNRLDQAILAAAFRGELVPQGPEDEPASIMLERIKREQVTATVPKARRGGKSRELAPTTS